ncbi:unnamed protein product [Blepharisma stoltei]|uniref:Iron-binding zinc finger CDGSH type domain-containing protein n=1 Tax=Blepharisma stoltei TaxID=1481888 RepID=A0AAU9JFL5_9CILI|nr:unnamed protein product [Blepharisma stoltei]
MSQEDNPPFRNPHNAIGVPGILKVHRKDLEKKKLDIRISNEKYLRDHPELTVMLQIFMRETLNEHPENVLQFAGWFFDREELRDIVNWGLQQQSPAEMEILKQKGHPQKGPYAVELEPGVKYFYCDCGKSKTQPFCDGSHQGSIFAPIQFEVSEKKTYYLCGCKCSKNKQFCDGTHNDLDW